MRRRAFITLLGGAVLSASLSTRARAAKPYRVAFFALLDEQDEVIVRQRLAELGYSEGKNLIFDFRSAAGERERLPQLAAELVKTKPDVIVTGFGTMSAKAAQAATAIIPIVFTSVGDPIGSGVVASLNRPGANITGLSSQTTEINGKRRRSWKKLRLTFTPSRCS